MSTSNKSEEQVPEWVKRPRIRYRLNKFDIFIVVSLVLGFLTLLFWPLIFFVVEPGNVGVLFRTLTTGTQTNFVHEEGLGSKLPWNRIYKYEVRTQSIDFQVHGLATDGLRVNVDVTVLYRPIKDNVGHLHREVGPHYRERLVLPQAIESVRDVVSSMQPHELYQLDLVELEAMVMSSLQAALKGTDNRYILWQAVIIRRVQLPSTLNTAITNKLTQEQNALAYEYILEQEEQEAERKRIEAIGYQTFYSIVADSLSPQLLTWRGIQATVDIAKSENSKIVIVGGGTDQMPLILGSDIASQPTLPAPPAVDPQSNALPNFGGLQPLFPPPVINEGQQSLEQLGSRDGDPSNGTTGSTSSTAPVSTESAPQQSNGNSR